MGEVARAQEVNFKEESADETVTVFWEVASTAAYDDTHALGFVGVQGDAQQRH